jgi:DNA-binding transcriptional LysR family regulator
MEDQALSVARAAAGLLPEIKGPVRLTSTETFGASFIAPRLRHFATRFPGIQIELMTDNSNLSLARRDADVAIRHGRPPSSQVVARRLAGIAYNLYAARSLLRAQTAGRLGYIGYDDANAYRPEAEHFARLLPDARIVLRTNSLQVRMSAARAGLGAALLPRFAAQDMPDLVRVDPAEPPLVRDLWLLVHNDLKDVPRIRQCTNFIQEIVEEERDRLG